MFSTLLICGIIALSINDGKSTSIHAPQNGAIAAETSGPRFARKSPSVQPQELLETSESRTVRQEVKQEVQEPQVDQDGRSLLGNVGGLLMGLGGALAVNRIAATGGYAGWQAKQSGSSLVEDKDVTYHFYSKKNKKEPVIIKATLKSPESLENWKPDQPTIIIIHGWMESASQPYNSAQRIKNAYLEESAKENFVLVDWSPHSSNMNYPEASKSSNQVAQLVTDFIMGLVDKKFVEDYSKIHVIGFSLGGHIAGIAGKRIQKKADGKKLGKITGLDVNWENYDADVDEEKRLTADDAEFVDVIHCNMGKKAGKFGTTLAIGTADFYPNGGISQPMCEMGGLGDPTGICSTNKCYEYYADSISGKKFKACPCDSYEKFDDNECECTNSAIMGAFVPTSAKGKYYLRVKA